MIVLPTKRTACSSTIDALQNRPNSPSIYKGKAQPCSGARAQPKTRHFSCLLRNTRSKRAHSSHSRTQAVTLSRRLISLGMLSFIASSVCIALHRTFSFDAQRHTHSAFQLSKALRTFLKAT